MLTFLTFHTQSFRKPRESLIKSICFYVTSVECTFRGLSGSFGGGGGEKRKFTHDFVCQSYGIVTK